MYNINDCYYDKNDLPSTGGLTFSSMPYLEASDGLLLMSFFRASIAACEKIGQLTLTI